MPIVFVWFSIFLYGTQSVVGTENPVYFDVTVCSSL